MKKEVVVKKIVASMLSVTMLASGTLVVTNSSAMKGTTQVLGSNVTNDATNSTDKANDKKPAGNEPQRCIKLYDVGSPEDKSISAQILKCSNVVGKAIDKMSKDTNESTTSETSKENANATKNSTESEFQKCIKLFDVIENDNGNPVSSQIVQCTRDKGDNEGLIILGCFLSFFKSTNNLIGVVVGVLNNLYNAIKAIISCANCIQFGINWANNKFGCKINLNMREVMENLDNELKVIQGQEKAKEVITEAVRGIIDRRGRIEASKGKNENEHEIEHGDVIYMIGPSGVGKTEAAKCIARAVMGKKAEIYSVDPGDLDESSYNGCFTPQRDKILHVKDGNFKIPSFKMEENSNAVENSLINKIRSNSNFVLILNEYDKMGDPSTDEMLRSIIDKGTVSMYGERIDCSKILIIITSNEDVRSIKESNTNKTAENDESGSRTAVKHDKSFLNRLKTVQFDALNKDDYVKIVEQSLKGQIDYYEKKYGIKIELSEKAKKEIAESAKAAGKGARFIEGEINDRLSSAFFKKVDISQEGKENYYKGKTLIADYDASNEKFTFTVKK